MGKETFHDRPGTLRYLWTTMRNTILLLAVLAAAPLAAQPGADQAPQAAKAHLAKTYPDAVVKEWKKTTKHVKAEFKVKGVDYDAYYSPEGGWVRTEHDIPKAALPAAVTSALKGGTYGAWKVDDVEEHATPQHALLYKVKVEGDTKEAELFFAPDGKLVRQEEKARD